MTMVRFEQVAIKATRRWTDADGHKHQQTQTFMQTINPFNLNKRGFIKSREEILAELAEERKQWLASEPPTEPKV